MSQSGSEAGTKEDAKTPETLGEAVKEIFVRILEGLGAVGRGLRGGIISGYTCVQRTVYPVKEGCVHGCDAVRSYLHPATARGGGQVPPAEAVRFTQGDMESDNESDKS